jgi:integrase
LLRPYLLALAKDRAPNELISRKLLRTGVSPDRHWLGRSLRDYCDDTKIPRVCLHSLRGLHATLATKAGVSSHVVASALGHRSPAVTQAHYIQAGTKQRVSARRVAAKLAETAKHRELHPVRGSAGTNEASSVPAADKRLSGLL